MFSKQTEYAIRALVYIVIQNMNNKRPGFKEIAKEIDSPVQYVAKILQNFTRHELLSSVRGRGGGFFFAKPDTLVPLYDIIKITEGERFFMKCDFGLQNCDAVNPCPLHINFTPIREELYRLMNEESIQSLAKKIINQEAVLKRANI